MGICYKDIFINKKIVFKDTITEGQHEDYSKKIIEIIDNGKEDFNKRFFRKIAAFIFIYYVAAVMFMNHVVEYRNIPSVDYKQMVLVAFSVIPISVVTVIFILGAVLKKYIVTARAYKNLEKTDPEIAKYVHVVYVMHIIRSQPSIIQEINQNGIVLKLLNSGITKKMDVDTSVSLIGDPDKIEVIFHDRFIEFVLPKGQCC